MIDNSVLKQKLHIGQYANMDLHRILSYMPTWSLAHKLYYSNAGKILAPLYEKLSSKLTELDVLLTNNLGLKTLPFGYSASHYKTQMYEIPSTIKTNHGECVYVGELGETRLEMHPISKVDLKAEILYAPFKYEGTNFDSPTILSWECVLYVTCPSASFLNSEDVLVEGYDSMGVFRLEVVTCISGVTRATINLYRYVTKVEATASVIVLNEIDLGQDFSGYTVSSSTSIGKRITSSLGSYFDPAFSFSGREVSITNSTDGNNDEEYRFFLDIPDDIEQMFVNNLLDITVKTVSGDVYCGKLMLDFYSASAHYELTNNNPAIELEYDQDDMMSFFVDIDFLKNDVGASKIQIELFNNDKFMYMDQSGQVTANQFTTIDTSGLSGRISFSVRRTNGADYEVAVRTDATPEVFSALAIRNELSMNKVGSNVSSIKYINNNLIFVQYGYYFMAKPIRLVFVSSGNEVHFFNDFEIA